MRGNKTIMIAIVLIFVVIIGLAAVYFFVLQPPGDNGDTGDMTPTEEYGPSNFTEIVVSSQNIPLGMPIRVGDFAVELQPWPNEYLPRQYFTSLNEVDGRYARMDIPLGMPLMPNMVGAEGGMLNVTGSAASFFSPNNRVAYAVPMDAQGAVAWALKPGDHIDVIAAINLTPIDAEFQSPYPLQFIAFPQTEDEGVIEGQYFTGRFENLPNGQPTLIYGNSVISTMIVQLTVQDAIVWQVGLWQDADTAATPVATADPDTGGGGLMGAAPQPEATPAVIKEPLRDIEPVTLLVTREDAMVLKYLLEMGADLDFVLRPAGFKDLVIQPQPVWSRFVIDKYQLPADKSDLPVAPAPVRVPMTLLPVAPTPEE